jgi:hypothetical protein
VLIDEERLHLRACGWHSVFEAWRGGWKYGMGGGAQQVRSPVRGQRVGCSSQLTVITTTTRLSTNLARALIKSVCGRFPQVVCA